MNDEMKKRIREKMYEDMPEGEPGPAEGEGLSGEEEQVDPREGAARRLKIIENLASSLVSKRNTAVTARAGCGIERIWREDELAFEGVDEALVRARMIDYATGDAYREGSSKEPKRSKVVINIVRPKCETAEGRFSDILLPTDDKNWGLKTTPKPELVRNLNNETPAVMKATGEPALGADGQQLSMKVIATAEKEKADGAMEGMEREIDDQLTECSFNAECRKMIRNSVRLGTGILKGPSVIKEIKKTWGKKTDGAVTVRVLMAEETQVPASYSVDPWDVFPDPECREDIKRAGYIWERRSITPRELRGLIGLDGYLEDQIRSVLEEQPRRVTTATEKENNWLIKYETLASGSSYELWEYNGDVGKDELIALGVDASSSRLPMMSACVVMVNDRPIKAVLNPLDTGDLPYDFFQWTERSGVPWGIGVARILIWTQRVLIAAWRAMMDNAGDSAGANIVVGADVEPMDTKWEITGKKLWRSKDSTQKIDHQFGQFQIANNQVDLQNIIEIALKFADMESQLPMIFNGEKGELPKTLGATNIMVDSANVALRTRVKRYDDCVTRPHIARYYDWNMQYNENDEIKGDYKVDARGTSVLLERDQEAQDVKEFMSLRADPELRAMIDWEKALKKLILARKADVLLPEDQIKKNLEELRKAPPVGDPTIQAAQIRVQGEIQKSQMTLQAAEKELQIKGFEADKDRQFQYQVKLLEREIEAMKLSAVSGIELAKIKKDLTIMAQKLNTQIEMSKDRDAKPSSQLTEPPIEPPEKAAPGYAFQQ